MLINSLYDESPVIRKEEEAATRPHRLFGSFNTVVVLGYIQGVCQLVVGYITQLSHLFEYEVGEGSSFDVYQFVCFELLALFGCQSFGRLEGLLAQCPEHCFLSDSIHLILELDAYQLQPFGHFAHLSYRLMFQPI